MPDAQTHPGQRSPARRTIVKGAAWAVPVVAIGAPAAHAGPSLCAVSESYALGPLTNSTIRAICEEDSQKPTNPEVINAEYGTAYLPTWLEICNCQQTPGWYRWQETDTRSNFQVEVDDVHNDQNSGTQGFRPPFYLESFGDEGGCRRFTLSYRASASIPQSQTGLNITWVLQRSTGGQSGPWVHVQTFTLNTVRPGGWVKRNGSNPNFNCRWWQRNAEGTASQEGSDQAAVTAAPDEAETVVPDQSPLNPNGD